MYEPWAIAVDDDDEDITSSPFQPAVHQPKPITPNFLFGEQTKRRATMGILNMRTPQRVAQEGKSVSWSPQLTQTRPLSEDGEPSLMDVETPFRTPPEERNLSASRGAVYVSGPPLRSLTDDEDFKPRPCDEEDAEEKVAQKSDAPEGVDKEYDFWVRVVGHQAEDINDLVKFFSRHGNIVSFQVPERGNWLWLRYACTIHVTQAMSFSGRFFKKNVMLGVVGCFSEKDIPGDADRIRQYLVTGPSTSGLRNGAENSDVSPAHRSGIRPLSATARQDSPTAAFQDVSARSILGTLWNIIAP
uniref:Nucleoporin NUP35 n=1 Tax=Steinernema glaseri TaxID=37863 RepID=A0A1I7ZNS6_9BILA